MATDSCPNFLGGLVSLIQDAGGLRTSRVWLAIHLSLGPNIAWGAETS